jgi:hypothetical protein
MTYRWFFYEVSATKIVAPDHLFLGSGWRSGSCRCARTDEGETSP